VGAREGGNWAGHKFCFGGLGALRYAGARLLEDVDGPRACRHGSRKPAFRASRALRTMPAQSNSFLTVQTGRPRRFR